MPRKSNQTQYDDMMSVFKQHGDRPSRSSRHAHTSAQAADSSHSQLPRSHTPRPAQVAPTTASSYPTYPIQQQVSSSSATPGLVSPQGWGEQYPSGSPTYQGLTSQDTSYSGLTYDPMSYDPSGAVTSPSASTYPSSSHWTVQFVFTNGQSRRLQLPIQRHQVPELTCPCGCHIRFVHLPTLVGWTPPFGVLWNFQGVGVNVWRECLQPPNACVSMAQCAGCKARISLYGPQA